MYVTTQIRRPVVDLSIKIDPDNPEHLAKARDVLDKLEGTSGSRAAELQGLAREVYETMMSLGGTAMNRDVIVSLFGASPTSSEQSHVAQILAKLADRGYVEKIARGTWRTK
jgi:hypothetical protein